MHHLDLLRTVHLPVSPDGRLMKNSFGVVIAETTDITTAIALAELINLGRAPAEELNRQHEAREAGASAMFARSLKTA